MWEVGSNQRICRVIEYKYRLQITRAASEILTTDLPVLTPSHSELPSKESIVCYFHIFLNDLRIKRKFTKYLKESCCLTSVEHFSFKYFPKNAFVIKIFPKMSGLLWPL